MDESGSSDDGYGDITVAQVSCKPLGHPDSEPYPSEEIVQQFFKEVSALKEKLSCRQISTLMKRKPSFTILGGCWGPGRCALRPRAQQVPNPHRLNARWS